MTTAYPTSLPTADIQNIVMNIAAGSVVANKQSFAKSVWVLEGFAFRELFGEEGSPTPPAPTPANPNTRILSATPALGSGLRELSDEEVADILRPLVVKDSAADVVAIIATQIPWAEILAWAIKVIPPLIHSGK